MSNRYYSLAVLSGRSTANDSANLSWPQGRASLTRARPAAANWPQLATVASRHKHMVVVLGFSRPTNLLGAGSAKAVPVGAD